MEVVKTTDQYTIYKKRSNRYAVKDANKRYINGDDKTQILLEADLIKLRQPNPDKASAEDATPAAEGDAVADAESA